MLSFPISNKTVGFVIFSLASIFNVIISPSFAKEGIKLFDSIVKVFIIGAVVSTITVDPLVSEVIVEPEFPVRSE